MPRPLLFPGDLVLVRQDHTDAGIKGEVTVVNDVGIRLTQRVLTKVIPWSSIWAIDVLGTTEDEDDD